MKSILALALLLSLQDSRETWEARAKELEDVLRGADAVDTVFLKDGRKLSGKIDEETPEHVRLKVKLGSMKLAREDVARVERSPNQEFLTKLASARGKAPELQALMEWATKNNLAPGRELAACLLLALDPAHAAAKAALASGQAAERDVLHLKDGTRKEGIIASETEDAIILEIPLRGSKGETMGLGKTVVPKAQIQRIERMPDAARAKARERLSAFNDRAALLNAALEKIRPVPEPLIEGRPGFKTPSDVFVLHSTGSELLAKETTHALNQMFAAFQRHFSVRRNAGKKVDVYFFVNRAEYDAFQTATTGGAVMNPAYYDPRANHIAAFNRVETAKAEAVRKAILDAEKEIEGCKDKVNKEEVRINKQVREIRAKLDEMAAAAKKEARGNPTAEAEINRQKKEILDDLKKREQEVREELNGYRKQMDAEIERNRGVIRSNRAVLVNQSRAMYETLFHETFHAFAANYLWTEKDDGKLPHWLHEGMATYYERSVVEAGELIHGSIDPGMLELAKEVDRAAREGGRGGRRVVRGHPSAGDRPFQRPLRRRVGPGPLPDQPRDGQGEVRGLRQGLAGRGPEAGLRGPRREADRQVESEWRRYLSELK
jgi:hypothetical protein